MNAFLSIKNIVKDYGHTRALDHVSIDLDKGKIYGLVGENGAGKTTLAKIISGGLKCGQGEICFKGKTFSYISPRQARELGISIVYQEGNLAPNLNVVDNIFLGNEKKNKLNLLVKKKMIDNAKDIIENFNIDISMDTPVEELSPTYQQIVAIAKALSLESNLLIIDEGGSALDRKELEDLFSVLKKMKELGVTIIYISHLLDNVINISDEIIILRNGKLVKKIDAKDTNISKLVMLMVGHEIISNKNKRIIKEKSRERIKVDSLVPKHNNNEEYSFSVKKGEILGITGPAGSGKNEILRMIYGISSIKKGYIYLDGQMVENIKPYIMVQKRVAYVPEDRHIEGLLISRSIEENITLPSLKKWSNFLIKKSRLNHIANKAADIARIKRSSIEDTPRSLSGGNQQKVVIARWLTKYYDYFLLSEPFKGIDVGAKEDIRKILIELAKDGCSIIIVTTEFSDLIGFVDRLLVMVEKKIVKELHYKSITNTNIMKYYQSTLS